MGDEGELGREGDDGGKRGIEEGKGKGEES